MTTPVSDDEMRALCEKATPETWDDVVEGPYFAVEASAGPVTGLDRDGEGFALGPDDAAFIAAARSWIPMALERLRELDEILDEREKYREDTAR